MRRAWWISAITLLFATAAWACDTPVYRYAMYQWAPASYSVYVIHNGPLEQPHQAVVEQLEHAATNPPSINLAVSAVDLAVDSLPEDLPPPLRRLTQQAAESSVPQYLITTPHGSEVYSGPMTEPDVAALVDSPGRRAIAQRLESGDGCVLVLLSGLVETSPEETTAVEDVEATDTAEQQVEQLVDDVMSGKVELHSAPAKNLFGVGSIDDFPSTGDPLPSETDPAAGGTPNPDSADSLRTQAKPRHEISYLRISRTDPAEQWLVRSLMAVEPDLPELAEPMVFPIYGRGRALPPYVGKGIERNNLLDVVEYVTGACSCTVKEQNPGMDLLIRYDWQTAAEKLAERFGAEEGNDMHFASDQLFPQLLLPAANPDAMLAEADDMAGDDPQPSDRSSNDQSTDTADGKLNETRLAEVPDASPAGTATAHGGPAQPVASSVTYPAQTSTVDLTVPTLVVVVVGLVLLAIATVFVARRKKN